MAYKRGLRASKLPEKLHGRVLASQASLAESILIICNHNNTHHSMTIITIFIIELEQEQYSSLNCNSNDTPHRRAVIASWRDAATGTQKAQYTSIQANTLKYRGLNIMV